MQDVDFSGLNRVLQAIELPPLMRFGSANSQGRRPVRGRSRIGETIGSDRIFATLEELAQGDALGGKNPSSVKHGDERTGDALSSNDGNSTQETISRGKFGLNRS